MSEEPRQPCPQCGGIHESGNCQKGQQSEPEDGSDFGNTEQFNQYGGTSEDPLNIACITREDVFSGPGLWNPMYHREFDRVHALIAREHVPQEVIWEKAGDALLMVIGNGNFDSAMEIIAEFDMPENVVHKVVKDILLIKIKKFSVEEIEKILAKFVMADELLLDPDVREAIKVALESSLRSYKNYSADRIVEFIELLGLKGNITRLQELRALAIRLVDPLLPDRVAEGEVRALIAGFELSENELKHRHIILLTDWITSSVDIGTIGNYIARYSLTDTVIQSPEIQSVVVDALLNQFRSEFDVLIKLFKLTWEKIKETPPFSSIIERLRINNCQDLEEFVRKYATFVTWLSKQKEDCVLDAKDLDRNLGIGLIELNFLKKTGFDLDRFTEKDNEQHYHEAFESIGDSEAPDWKDKENISGPFENGAQKFGYKKMFQYIGREGLSRHDALHNFNKILELLATSGLKPEQFYGQILDQARMDDGHYETGTAHHELNSLANNINLNIQETVVRAQKYADIEKMQVLAQDLGAPEQVFASWKNLKKYGELCNLLGRTEILDQLQELKKSGKMKLYRFVETLAFHPNIDMKAVFQFWRDPEQFLDLTDNHDAAKVHDRKKPSNYTHIPNLDLTAEDLRDAQVEGDLDKLQAFRPLEIVYDLPQSGEVVGERETNLIVLMKEALGSHRDKKEGKAKDPKKLFKQLQDLFKEAGLKFQDYLAGKLQIDTEFESKARELVQSEKIGYVKKPAGEVYRYRAKINLKSDPDGVVAGNDTACCMPFGSGKNNIYTFNPVCSLFTIQQERGDGTWRTVAQSVLTKDKDIKKNISEVMKQMTDPEKPPIGSVLSEDVLNQGESILACDNVELTPNVKGHKLTEAQVELIYRDFMAEYLARYAKQDNLATNQVVIGQGYSDSLTHLPQIPNTYAPSAPVGYSDKTHEKVYQLTPKLAEGIKKQVIESDLPGGKKAELITGQRGVSYLTFEDTLPVAFIEGKAYHDNQTLIQYLHNMENALIAKDISNVSKDRPNMSLKHTGEDGRIHGYMLAYEGRMNEDEEEGSEKVEPIIFVSDIASDLKHPGTGGALMRAFLEQYRQNYISKGNFVPVYAQAREKTSYAIIKSKLKKYGEEVGLELEMEELGTYQEGDDTMHQIIIRVKR